MNRNVINKAFLAVFYFNLKGLKYDINNSSDREKARSHLSHTTIDKELLAKAFEMYIEYQRESFESLFT